MTPTPRFRELPLRLRALTIAQAVSAGAAAAWLWEAPRAGEVPLFAALCVLGLGAGAFKVELCVRWGRITMAFGVTCFAFLALGAGAAMAVNALAALGGLCLNQREGGRRFGLRAVPGHRLVFNLANYVVCVAVAEMLFRLLGGREAGAAIQGMALPVLAAAVGYYVANTLGVAAALAWSGGRSAWTVWRENFAWAAPGYLATACGAAGALFLYRQLTPGPWALFLLPPFYLVFHSYRVHVAKARADVEHMRAVNRLSQSIITSLALAIDAKDRVTHRHIHRVREYAVSLAEALGLTGAEMESVRIAGLLHDIGKLGISERILCKPDKLTPVEYAVIQGHVALGARILEPVEFPWPVIPIVLTHHERWDGLGYPRGLRGEEIPLGGRIVALADVFDALTSERPYRRAMSRDQALNLVREGAGTQFDPRVVAAFERILPEIEARIRALEAAAVVQPAALPWPAKEVLGRPAGRPIPLPEAALPLLPERATPREAAAWLAQAMRDTLPTSLVCVYLRGSETDALRVEHAEGLQAERWLGMEVRIGEGAVGHVFLEGRPLIGVPASLDLARRVPPGEALELSSALALPVQCVSDPAGVVVLYHTAYDVYDAAHARRGLAIATAAAPALGAAVPSARGTAGQAAGKGGPGSRRGDMVPGR